MKRLAFLPLLFTAACQAADLVNPSNALQAGTAAAIPYATATKPPAMELAPVYVPAICTLMGQEVRSEVPAGHPVILVWAWSAATEEQIDEYLQASSVVVTFDGIEIHGEPLDGIPYDELAKVHKAVWIADVGPAKPGIHTITYSLTFSRKIFDGIDYYGPGTMYEKQEDKCEIEVK